MARIIAIIIGEFLFVILSLILVFGTLNYFHILNVGLLFQKRTLSLPSLHTSVTTSTTKALPLSSQQLSQLHTQLASYIAQTLQPDYAPEDTLTQSVSSTSTSIALSWTAVHDIPTDITSTATLNFSPTTLVPSTIMYHHKLDNIEKAYSQDPSTLNALAKQYIKTPDSGLSWTCTTSSPIITCISNLSQREGLYSFALTLNITLQQGTFIYCFAPVGGAMYLQGKTCLLTNSSN